ncbi:MAG TPA: alpha-hydroxy acid oxidase [Thermoplasmata archaeon]|nr:alpha-hydroxy acid oxidase [Thermoplasmata archaeon]
MPCRGGVGPDLQVLPIPATEPRPEAGPSLTPRRSPRRPGPRVSAADTAGAEGFRSLSGLEAAARSRLPPGLWDYVQGGSGEERTLAANREAFRRDVLTPKILAGVHRLDPSTRLLDQPVRAPFFISPMAYQGQVHPAGEPAMARAAARAGVLMVLSTLSTASLEDVASASGAGPRWFQLYLQPEFERTETLVRRAERAGYSAIVLTADVPLLAVRDRQSREGFALNTPVALGNGPEFVTPARDPASSPEGYALRPDGAADWGILDQLRGVTRLPIVVKGVLRPDDARTAAEHGASGVIVSNHGGRQLDGAPATLDALPAIVDAVGSKLAVYLDGGVRRASDVLLAMALGAQGVGIGRPALWALAADGERGVGRFLELLTTELVNSMALLGISTWTDLDRSFVRVR